MKINELRQVVQAILTEADLSKYSFLGKDTLDLLKKFVWRFSADVANTKAAANKQNDPGATRVDATVGQVKADGSEVKDVAQDVMLSIQASVDDLIKHFGVGGGSKPIKAPPPSRAGSRPGV